MARPLTIEEAEYIAHALALELMNYIDEPIPPFNTRSPGILESCLLEPFQTFDGKNLHSSFVRKCAVLFYLCIKNHPFQNGNKRMAVVLTAVFCYLNKHWINIGTRDLYDIACLVAASQPRNKDDVITSLEKKLNDDIIPISRFGRIVRSK